MRDLCRICVRRCKDLVLSGYHGSVNVLGFIFYFFFFRWQYEAAFCCVCLRLTELSISPWEMHSYNHNFCLLDGQLRLFLYWSSMDRTKKSAFRNSLKQVQMLCSCSYTLVRYNHCTTRLCTFFFSFFPEPLKELLCFSGDKKKVSLCSFTSIGNMLAPAVYLESVLCQFALHKN